MTRDDVARWLDRYIDAWRTYDRDAIRALFRRRRRVPLPPVGRAGPRRRRRSPTTGSTTRHPGTYDAAYEPYAVDGNRAVALGTSDYTGDGRRGQPALPQRVLHRVRRRRGRADRSPRSSPSRAVRAAPREATPRRRPGIDGTRRRPGTIASMHARSVRHVLPTRIVAAHVALAAVASAALATRGAAPVFAASDTVRARRHRARRRARGRRAGGQRRVPLRVTWTAKDPRRLGVVATRLPGPDRRRIVGEGRRSVGAGRAPGRRSPSGPPHDAQFRARAIDAAGNRAPGPRTTRSGSAPVGGRAERGRPAAAARRGDRGHLGDRARRTRQAGASSRSRSPAARSPGSGGGRRTAALRGVAPRRRWSRSHGQRTHAATRSDRRILYVATWPDAGEHTITIRRPSAPPATRTSSSTASSWATRRRRDPVLVGAGDMATCGDPGDNRTAELLDAIPGRRVRRGRHRLSGRHRGQCRDCYDPTWGRWRDRDLARDRQPRVQHRRRPALLRATSAAGPATRGKGWYAEDLGTWRVYWLNTNCDRVGCGAVVRAGRVARRGPRGEPARLRRRGHAPPLVSSGEHGDNPAVARRCGPTLEDAGARPGRRRATTTTTSGSRRWARTRSGRGRHAAVRGRDRRRQALRPFDDGDRARNSVVAPGRRPTACSKLTLRDRALRLAVRAGRGRDVQPTPAPPSA